MCCKLSCLSEVHDLAGGCDVLALQDRHRLNGYLAQRVPSLLLASSSRKCFNCAALKCMFPWRTRYPLSSSPKLVPHHSAPAARLFSVSPSVFPRLLPPGAGTH